MAKKGKAAAAAKGKGGRVSVAAARKSSGDRTQLIIGGVAIVIIVAVIVVGVMMNAKNSATIGDGYGVSTKSVATVEDGVITVNNGNPDLSLDVYEDALCPICADLEHQYGQQMAKAVDEGLLELKFRMVDFLNRASASGDYSTRALAALQTVAAVDGDKPGVFMKFHTSLYDAKNQPKENGSKDLSNEDLAKLAGKAGASDEAQQQIKDGVEVADATTNAQTNLASLTEVAASVGRGAGTPTVALNGTPLPTNDTAWLTNLLPDSFDTGEGSDDE